MRNIPYKLLPLFISAFLLFILTSKTASAQGVPYPYNWYQSVGVDMRNDKGFRDLIPILLPTAITDDYASLPGTGGMPGIVFGKTLNFGKGQASNLNWQAKGDDVILNGNQIQTSYNSLRATIQGSGITITKITDQYVWYRERDETTFHNIDLSPLPTYESGDVGVYFIDATSLPYEGEATIGENITVESGKNYIFLIKGDLRIMADIIVEEGATAIFSASGDIKITAPDVVHTDEPGSQTIEGLYSADHSFITDECYCGTDKQQFINGAVIVNAARNGGEFINQRSLHYSGVFNYNRQKPAIVFNERPDFILNYPSVLKKNNNNYWKEVAP